MNFWRNSIQKYYSKLIFFPVYIQFNKIFIQYKKGVPPRANPPPDPPPPTHTNSYLQRRLIVDFYYYFSGKTFKAATKLTPRDAELVAKVKFCQSFIGMGMVVLMMEVIVKVIHFLQFWWGWWMLLAYLFMFLSLFIGPRCPWSDLCVRMSLRQWVSEWDTLLRLNWCDSGWWRYQVNTNW